MPPMAHEPPQRRACKEYAFERVLQVAARRSPALDRGEGGTVRTTGVDTPGHRYPQIGTYPQKYPHAFIDGGGGQASGAAPRTAGARSWRVFRRGSAGRPWTAMDACGPLWTNSGGGGSRTWGRQAAVSQQLRPQTGRASYPRLYPHAPFDEIGQAVWRSFTIDDENFPRNCRMSVHSQPGACHWSEARAVPSGRVGVVVRSHLERQHHVQVSRRCRGRLFSSVGRRELAQECAECPCTQPGIAQRHPP